MFMTLLHTVQRATGVPEGGIEPPPFAYETNELATCSTPACSLLSYERADDGSRTRDYCLEGNGFTVKLHPQELY